MYGHACGQTYLHFSYTNDGQLFGEVTEHNHLGVMFNVAFNEASFSCVCDNRKDG